MEMEKRLKDIAERIYAMRDIFGYSIEEMAEATELTCEEYEAYEKGECDFSFTFLYNVARKLGIDMTELFTGETPNLSSYCVVRRGEGLSMERNRGFKYGHLAYLVKDRIGDPFLVYAKYSKEDDEGPVHLNYHEGQEFDYILNGKLKVMIDENEYILEPGDSIYYNSSHGHGMVATDGEDCTFLAIVMKERGKGKGETK